MTIHAAATGNTYRTRIDGTPYRWIARCGRGIANRDAVVSVETFDDDETRPRCMQCIAVLNAEERRGEGRS